MSKMDLKSLKRMGQNGPKFCEREFNRKRLITKLEFWMKSLKIKKK